MSARVLNNEWGMWVGVCSECRMTISGGMASVDSWADIHNEDYHQDNQLCRGCKEPLPKDGTAYCAPCILDMEDDDE